MEKNNEISLYEIAMQEMENGEYEYATKHFEEVYLKDSSNWMANFYKSYCKAMYGKVGEMSNQCLTLTAAFKVAYSQALGLDENKRIEVIKELVSKVISKANQVRINVSYLTLEYLRNAMNMLLEIDKIIMDNKIESTEFLDIRKNLLMYTYEFNKDKGLLSKEKRDRLVQELSKFDSNFVTTAQKDQTKFEATVFLGFIVLVGIVVGIYFFIHHLIA